jgi:DHA2 family multidrug resistance protein-like MFS transporter
MGTFFLLPFYLEEIFHLPLQTVGWLLAVVSLSNALVSPLGGLCGDRWGNMAVLRLGALLIMAGLTALWWWGPYASLGHLVAIFAITGMGFGLFQAPNLNDMLQGVKTEVLGLAAGTNAVLKNLGALLGIACLVTVITWGQASPPALRTPQCLQWGCFQRAFLAAVCLAGLNVVLNLLPRRRPAALSRQEERQD